MCSVALLIGMLLGAISATNTGSLSVEHRPELNAIVPHAIAGAVVGVSALIVSLRSRSFHWVTWPISTRTTSRAAWTIRSARTSFGGVIRTVIGTALMVFNFFLVFRMGFQATVGFNPALTLNAWAEVSLVLWTPELAGFVILVEGCPACQRARNSVARSRPSTGGRP
ncbi:hypothetical protein, partial [Brevibacterium sp. 239c]|uniref:hypothetical protein n=1 Tax=Brevibacterium sp. 239c TaxID=1965356 RepID=UPI001C6085BD